MSLVSILIPAFNRADYLPETIASALAQSYRDIELVVVDDGSTDPTRAVVHSFSDARVRYLYQENRGVSAALNTAWRAASGEFLAFLGSDDLMLSRQVETLMKILEADPSLGLAYARAQAMNAQGDPLPQILGSSLKFRNNALQSMLYGDSVCGIACLTRRAHVERVGGFDESLIANEDWDMWIRLAEQVRFAYRDEILARYRMHSSSLTGARSEHYHRVIMDRLRLIETYYSQPNLRPDALAVKSLALRNVYMDAGIRFLSIGERKDALRYLSRAVRVHGNPLVTAARVAGVTLFDLYLSKTRWGVRMTDRIVARRRKAHARV